MNVLTNKKKLFICEVAIYIYEMERQERLARVERCQRSSRSQRLPKLPNLSFGKRSRQTFLLNLSRNIFPFISFFGIV